MCVRRGKAAEWDGPRTLSGSLSADPGLLQVLLVLLVGRGVIIVTAGIVAEVKIRHIRRIEGGLNGGSPGLQIGPAGKAGHL